MHVPKVDQLSALPPELFNNVVGFFKKPKPILALAQTSSGMHSKISGAMIQTTNGKLEGEEFLKWIRLINQVKLSENERLFKHDFETKPDEFALGWGGFKEGELKVTMMKTTFAAMMPFVQLCIGNQYPQSIKLRLAAACFLSLVTQAVAVSCLRVANIPANPEYEDKSFRCRFRCGLQLLFALFDMLLFVLAAYFSGYIVDSLKEQNLILKTLSILFTIVFVAASDIGITKLVKEATFLYSAKEDNADFINKQIEIMFPNDIDDDSAEEIISMPGLIN